MTVKNTGRFVTFEGTDGSGKTTQLNAVAAWLEQKKGIGVFKTHEPGGGNSSIRNILLKELSQDIPARADIDLWLFLADRAVHIPIIREHLSRGQWMLCDRFSGSTLAYQGYAKGVDLCRIRAEDVIARQGLDPDLIILCDVDPNEGIRRMDANKREKSSFDKLPVSFHKKVREGFLDQVRRTPQRWFVVDAACSADDVTKEIIAELERKFAL